jgi:hypothetical protein
MRMRWSINCVSPASRLRSNAAFACTTMTWWAADTSQTCWSRTCFWLKAVKALDNTHRMQCTNCHKASGLQLCLLLDFGKPRLEIKGVVHGL